MLRERLEAGEALVGSYVTFPAPEVVEVFAAAGMDYAVIDLQHASPDWQTVAHMIRAAEARGIAPLVRAHDHDPASLLKLLEIGAEGLMLPGVETPEAMRAIAAAVFYPPHGHRSACGHTRVGAYNPRRDEFPSHMRRQNARILLWALLESPEAVARAAEIAAVQPGAGVIGVGRGDLSVAIGRPGEIDHPEVVARAERVIGEVRTHSGGACATSVMIQRVEDVSPWHARGCRLFTFSADAVLLVNAARGAVDGFRAALRGRG